MKQVWLMVLESASFNSLWSQEVKHTPTVEQCRADQQLSWSKIKGANRADIPNVRFLELFDNVRFIELWDWQNEMQDEMRDCVKVDPDNADSYFNLVTAVADEQSKRLFLFVSNHHLLHQFLAEDAQGKFVSENGMPK